jgi:RNA polymerase sigma-70 factor (ECF subfamily)
MKARCICAKLRAALGAAHGGEVYGKQLCLSRIRFIAGPGTGASDRRRTKSCRGRQPTGPTSSPTQRRLSRDPMPNPDVRSGNSMQANRSPLSLSRTSDVTSELLAALPKLRAVAIYLCGRSRGRSDRAEDLVQKTVIKALENIHSYAPDSNMIAWLSAILRNEYYAEYRKGRHEIEDEDGTCAAMMVSLPTQEVHIRFVELGYALDRLRPKDREALLLLFVSELSYAEAAKACACAVGTMKSRVHRARSRLAQILNERLLVFEPISARSTLLDQQTTTPPSSISASEGRGGSDGAAKVRTPCRETADSAPALPE